MSRVTIQIDGMTMPLSADLVWKTAKVLLFCSFRDPEAVAFARRTGWKVFYTAEAFAPESLIEAVSG